MNSFGTAKRKCAILTIDKEKEKVHNTIVYQCIMKRVRIYYDKIRKSSFK